jgi:probable rRNA maturation factor
VRFNSATVIVCVVGIELTSCFDSIPSIDVTLNSQVQFVFGAICVLYDIRVHNARGDDYIVDEATVQIVITGIFHWAGEKSGRYIKPGILEVSFVSEEEIKAVNGEYRSKPYVTDVLSFYYLSEYGDALQDVTPLKAGRTSVDEIVGELLICPEQAKRQAREFGNDFSGEIGRLIVHGALHIAGFEHENVSERVEQEMVDAENFLFDRYSNLFVNFSWVGA